MRKFSTGILAAAVLACVFIPKGYARAQGWEPLTSGTYKQLESIWGSAWTNVFAVGGDFEGPVTLNYDDTTWTAVNPGTNQVSFDVWGASGTAVFAVGNLGFHGAFAQVGQLESKFAHPASITRRMPSTRRCWTGKYCHSKAWG